MSWRACEKPWCEAGTGPVSLSIEPRPRDLGGGLKVRRVLLSARRRMVGPFIFLDHIGPSRFESGQGLDVRPHPISG